MNRKTPLIWTLVFTLLCGGPGIFILSISMLANQLDATILFLILIGLILLAIPLINVLRNFRSDKHSGITSLVLMTGLLGLMQICFAAFALLAGGTATDTKGIWNVLLIYSGSGLFLIVISISLFLVIRPRFKKDSEETAKEFTKIDIS